MASQAGLEDEAEGAPAGPAAQILRALRDYVRKGVHYDPSYRKLAFPGGAVPADRGACTDLVIAGLRAVGIDLQEELQQDIQEAPGAYRRSLLHYGSEHADPNIDHRRVANLDVYFRRHFQALGGTLANEQLRAGDLVVWDQNSDGWVDHVGVVSDRAHADRPLVYHNYPRRGHHPGVALEGDCLEEWKRVGHYRLPESSAP